MSHQQRDGRPSVLLADDHPVVLNGLGGLLELSGKFNIVASCGSGGEALEQLRCLEPDLAVLDVVMPDLTGVDLLKKIEEEGLRTRVVFLTAHASDEQITQAVQHGAWGIIFKDLAADQLVTCLDDVVAGQRVLSHAMVSQALTREGERQANASHFATALTGREREIASLVAAGLSNKQIARQLSVSEGTVKIHLHNVYAKLGVANRTALATLAQRALGP